MSRDPYLDVKREVEHNLVTTRSLLSHYDRLGDTAPSSSSAVLEVEQQLRETLALLQADLEDLEESVRVVESTGDRWGLDEDEVRRRRGFVERVKRQVESLGRKVPGTSGKGAGKGKGKQKERYRDVPDLEAGPPEDLEEQRRWEMEEQQMFVKRQDDTLGYISGTLSTLASQAGLIGSEVNQQSEMLDDLGGRVDHTDSRLRKVQRQMNDFIRRNEETQSGWCICILIFVLVILLVLVIIT